jgi:hypothetical protein
MGFVDLRCSQIEASDVRGLPDQGDDGRTHYLPPADMPVGDMTTDQVTSHLAALLDIKHEDGDKKTAEKIGLALSKNTDLEVDRKYYLELLRLQPRFQRGILFLDEVNRAQDDVLQAVFELVLDRKVGQYVLPPGWHVVTAGNFMEGYQVSGFNYPAFLDRFCHMTLSGGDSTLEEWVAYMTQAMGEQAADVIEYASQNVKVLDGDIKGELGFSVQPSRRSWEMVAKLQEVHRNGGENSKATSDTGAYFECLAGLVGRDLAAAFSRYSCPVKPRELLNQGVKPFESKLKSLNRNQLTGVMWGLVSFCKEKIDDDKTAEVCLDFAEFMAVNANDKDVVVAFCRALVSGKNESQEKARTAVISNPKLAEMIGKFNKKTGKAKKTFVDRLNERPRLQKILSKVAWGE